MNEVAAVLPKLTAVAPLRFVPVIVTVAPVVVVVGVNDVMVGGAAFTASAQLSLKRRPAILPS